MSTINNRRIAKNTMLLYIRMFLIMGVSLYTSRIILQALGVEDYGIYNLVGGFVTIFSIIGNTLVTAMQRYFNFALGQKDDKRFSDIFIMSINIMILIFVIIIVVSETVGIWFINTQLNIPHERMRAVNWVFQFSILAFIINLLRTPYNAAIIAHERMAFYAYVSIFDVALRLVVVYLLFIYKHDRLILYSILYFTVNLLITYLYKLYCNKKLNICRYKFMWNKNLFKELLSFTSYSLIGQTGYILRSQGNSFFVNRFYSVAVNAAMGVNSQVTGALSSFVSNFQLAFNPQITKSYAAKEMTEHFKLLFRASKFSFFLLLMLSIPVAFNINFILELWLVEVPVYTSFFVILGLIGQMILAMSAPFSTSIIATGKIKVYQISLFAFNILGIILSFFLLKIGFKPYIVSIVNIIVQSFIFISRLYFMRVLMDFEVTKYIKVVLIPVIVVTVLALLLPYFTNHLFETFFGVAIISIADIIVTIIIIYLIGLNREEREFIKQTTNKFILKLKN